MRRLKQALFAFIQRDVSQAVVIGRGIGASFSLRRSLPLLLLRSARSPLPALSSFALVTACLTRSYSSLPSKAKGDEVDAWIGLAPELSSERMGDKDEGRNEKKQRATSLSSTVKEEEQEQSRAEAVDAEEKASEQREKKGIFVPLPARDSWEDDTVISQRLSAEERRQRKRELRLAYLEKVFECDSRSLPLRFRKAERLEQLLSNDRVWMTLPLKRDEALRWENIEVARWLMRKAGVKQKEVRKAFRKNPSLFFETEAVFKERAEKLYRHLHPGYPLVFLSEGKHAKERKQRSLRPIEEMSAGDRPDKETMIFENGSKKKEVIDSSDDGFNERDVEESTHYKHGSSSTSKIQDEHEFVEREGEKESEESDTESVRPPRLPKHAERDRLSKYFYYTKGISAREIIIRRLLTSCPLCLDRERGADRWAENMVERLADLRTIDGMNHKLAAACVLRWPGLVSVPFPAVKRIIRFLVEEVGLKTKEAAEVISQYPRLSTLALGEYPSECFDNLTSENPWIRATERDDEIMAYSFDELDRDASSSPVLSDAIAAESGKTLEQCSPSRQEQMASTSEESSISDAILSLRQEKGSQRKGFGLRAKLHFLRTAWGLSDNEVATAIYIFPHFFSYSLENRMRPRLEFLERKGRLKKTGIIGTREKSAKFVDKSGKSIEQKTRTPPDEMSPSLTRDAKMQPQNLALACSDLYFARVIAGSTIEEYEQFLQRGASRAQESGGS